MAKVFNFFYVTHRKIILYGVFILYLLMGVFRTSTLDNIKIFNTISSVAIGFCALVLFIYLFIDFIKRKFSITPFLIIGVICAVVTLVFTHSTLICFFMGFLYVLKDYKFKEIAKIFAITTFIATTIVVLLAFNGIIENLVTDRGEIERLALGFKWSVPTITFFMFSVLAYNFVRKNEITIFELVAELLINYFLYYFTNTRTGYFLVIGIVLLTLLLKLINIPKIKNWFYKQKIVNKVRVFFAKDKVNKICSYFFACIPLIFIAFFGILVLLYGGKSDFILKINSLLSGRLELTYNAFLTRDITLFGGMYNWKSPSGRYIGVDSAFYHYLFNWGVIPTLFILFFTLLLFYKTFREKNYWLCFILIFVMCSAFIDTFYIELKFNVFLLALIDGNVGRKMMFGYENKLTFNVNIKNDGAKDMNKNIVAVVVTYNRKELLKECLQALIKQEYKNLKILVVDNNSNDGTKEFITDLIDNKKVLYKNTGKNLGGAGGFNFGMKEAMKLGSDYIWVMDDDCIVNETSLQGFLDFMDNHTTDFGFLSSKVVWKDGSICKMNEQKIDIKNKVEDFTKVQNIKLASFVSMFINVEVIEKLGLPIKDFFIWGDDWEFSNRVSEHYNNYLVPESVVTHKSNKNIGSDLAKDDSENLDRYFYAYRNEGYMYSKMSLSGKFYFFLKKMLHRFRILKSKSKNKKEKFKIMKKGLKAIKDFNPSIEYAYRPNTKITVCECFAEPLLYGGQEAFMLNMYKNFDDNQIKYTFFTPFESGNKGLLELSGNRNENIISYNYNFNSKFRKLYIHKAYKKFFKNNKFDVVHIQTGSVWALLNIAKIAKKNGIKRVIVHSHCTGGNNLKYKISKFISDKQIKKYADEYLACSRLAGEWKFPKDIIENNNCKVINNGIDIQKFTFKDNVRKEYRKTLKIEDKFVLLNVGRFSEQKNHKFIIEVVDKLKDKIKNLKVVLIGEGELKEQTLQTIKQRDLEKYFIVLEKRTDIPEIMMASDLFILPSLFEGLPVVAVEAQATGLVTLCSTNITEEVKVTDLCKMIGIDNVDIWVDEINKTYAQLQEKETKVNREKYSKIMKDAGYDAKQSAKLLEDIYLG